MTNVKIFIKNIFNKKLSISLITKVNLYVNGKNTKCSFVCGWR